MENIKVLIVSGYMGKPKIIAKIDEVDHVLETKEVEEYLLKSMLERGYKVEQTKRQQYPRVKLND